MLCSNQKLRCSIRCLSLLDILLLSRKNPPQRRGADMANLLPLLHHCRLHVSPLPPLRLLCQLDLDSFNKAGLPSSTSTSNITSHKWWKHIMCGGGTHAHTYIYMMLMRLFLYSTPVKLKRTSTSLDNCSLRLRLFLFLLRHCHAVLLDSIGRE